MAISQITVATPAAEILFTDTAMSNTADGVKSSSTLVYNVFVDNSLNGAATYVKLFNLAAGGVTVGTTVPDEVIFCPANSRITQLFFNNNAPGKTFGTALSACAVTTGGTAGATGPSSNCGVTISYV